MKRLILVCILTVNSVLLMAQDGYDLSRGLQDSYSLDSVVNDGTHILVARWLSAKRANLPCPLGAAGHEGEIQSLYRLYGASPDTFKCAFFTFYNATKRAPGTMQRDLTPKPGEVCLVIAKHYPNRPQYQVRRFIELTPANLELVSRLIREYKAKELAASPAAVTMLDQSMATAIKETARLEESRKFSANTPQESSIPPVNPMTALVGFVLVLLAAAVVFWEKRRSGS